MAYGRASMVEGSAAAIGTGNATLTAVTGYNSWSTVADGTTIHYAIQESPISTLFEFGLGTKTTVGGNPVLQRTAGNVLGGSSGAGALVNFTGAKQIVYIAPLGEAEVLPNVTADPSVASTGQITYRTDTDQLRAYAGTSPAWDSIPRVGRTNAFTKHNAFGADGLVDDGGITGGGSTYSNIVNIQETFSSNLTAVTYAEALTNYVILDPAADTTAQVFSLDFELSTATGNPHTFPAIAVTYFSFTHNGSGHIGAVTGAQSIIANVSTGAIDFVYAQENSVYNYSTGNIGSCYLSTSSGNNFGTATITNVYGYAVAISNNSTGTIGTLYGYFFDTVGNNGTITNNFAIYIKDQSGTGAAANYAFWYDSPGVFRIKSDGVMAYYNPAFAPKYTPNSQDFERVVIQWVSNCCQIGTENGSNSGVLRPLRLIGSGICYGTNAPNAASALQLDSTTQGFLPPRVTTTQRDAISTPPEGLVVYNSTKHVLDSYNGTSWQQHPRQLFDHYADAGNSTTTETDLYSDTLAASILGVNGDKIASSYTGTFVNSTSAKRLRVYFGGTLIFDTGALTVSAAADWVVNVLIIRDSSTSVRCSVAANLTGASTGDFANYATVTGLTLTNTQVLKITGTASGVGPATNDIVASMGTVSWQPSA